MGELYPEPTSQESDATDFTDLGVPPGREAAGGPAEIEDEFDLDAELDAIDADLANNEWDADVADVADQHADASFAEDEE